MLKHPLKLLLLCCLCFFCCLAFFGAKTLPTALSGFVSQGKETSGKVIDSPPYDALQKAMQLDIKSRSQEPHISWIDALAYLASLYNGDFKQYHVRDLDKFYTRLTSGETLQTLTSGLADFYDYQSLYTAAFQGFIGEYQVQTPPMDTEHLSQQEKYGLKAFFPIPRDFDFTLANKQRNMYPLQPEQTFFIPVGTPVIAVEGGIIQVMDWDSTSGWRIGIKSFDHQRCYYYTNLRKDEPYENHLYPGKAVNAGDVIAYSGQTGCSMKENANNLDQPQLSVSLQIWLKDGGTAFMDMQAVTELLMLHQQEVLKDESSEGYTAKYFISPIKFR